MLNFDNYFIPAYYVTSYYEQGKIPTIAMNYLTIVPPSGSSVKNFHSPKMIVNDNKHVYDAYVILVDFIQYDGSKIPVYLMFENCTRAEAMNKFANFYNTLPGGKINLYKQQPVAGNLRGYLVGGKLSYKPIRVMAFSYYQTKYQERVK